METKLPYLQPCDDPINKKCHDLCRDLYNKLLKKELELSEFLKEIAYVALMYGFNELIPRQYPQRPKELLEYDELSFKKKIAIKIEFWRQFSIENYLETYHKVKWWNKHTKDWLEELQNYIPTEDYPNQQKIKNRLLEFADNPVIDKLVETFDAKEY